MTSEDIFMLCREMLHKGAKLVVLVTIAKAVALPLLVIK
jgi:hypothetical protein